MSKHLQPNLKAMLPMLSAAGFAAQGDAERAMDMCLQKTTRCCTPWAERRNSMGWSCDRYEKLKSYGLGMNLVAYSTLIDAQAHTPST